VVLALAGFGGLYLVHRWLARRNLGVGYGVLWTGVFSALVIIAAFPVAVVWVGDVAGSKEPEGGLRLGAFLVAYILLLYLSVKTSLQQRRLEELVQILALRDAKNPERDRSADAQDQRG
jgi:hypothetical protein